MVRRPGPPRLDGGVEAKGLDEIVSDRLRDEILSGRFVGGEHIVDLELAQRFEVSQGTVRAALARLRNEGLIEVRARRGNFVRSITSNDVLEIYTLRDALEALGARLAAERLSEVGQRRLKFALQQLEKAIARGERTAIVDSDLGLHRAIVDLSGHSRLQKTYAMLEGQTRLFMALTDHLHLEAGDEVISGHRELVGAILDRDGDRAQTLALVHNRPDGLRLAAAIDAASPSLSDAPRLEGGKRPSLSPPRRPRGKAA